MAADLRPSLAYSFCSSRVNADNKPDICNRLDFKSLSEDFANQQVERFCFPEYIEGRCSVQPVLHLESEAYAFTLTGGDGSRTYGFCWRFLPKTHIKTFPIVLCVLSSIPWFSFFFKVLMKLQPIIEELPAAKLLDTQSEAARFMYQLFLRAQPPLGSEIYVKLRGMEERFTVPEDRDTGGRHEDVYFAPLLWRVPVDSALVLLASLLHERRVVITGCHLSSVSSAVHAAAAMLYPLTWQHIFIPILPHALMDYLTAPMPFLIGLPEPLLPLLRSLPTEELVLLNLDTGEVEYFEKDVSALPKKPRQKLEADLRQALHMVAHDDKVIARALLKFFVWIFGGYQPYVCTKLPQQEDGDGERDMGLQHEGLWFDHQAFVDSHTSTNTRAFLEYCRQTQMYEAFVRERLQLMTAGSAHGDAFERSALLRTQTITSKLESELGQKMVKMKGVKKKLSRSSSKIMSQSKAAAEQKVRKIMKRMSGVYNNPSSAFQAYVPNPMMGSTPRSGSSQQMGPSQTLSALAPSQDNTTESDSDTEQEPQLWTSFSTVVPERPREPHRRPSVSPSVNDEPSPSSESAVFSGFEDLCLVEGPPPAKCPAPDEFTPCPSSCPDPFADSFTDSSWQHPLPSSGKSAPIDHSLVSLSIQQSPAGAVQDAGDLLACALGMQATSSENPVAPEPPPIIDLLS